MIANLKAKLDALGQMRRQEPSPPPSKPEEAVCRVYRQEYPLDKEEGRALGRALRLPMEEVSVLCRTPLAQDTAMRDVLFLDTETTGLAGGSGVLAFLVGLGYYEDDCFVMEQFFLEDYDGEADMLQRVGAAAARHKVLASFNGKTFDLPLLQSRAIMNRQRLKVEDMPHLDLLHACRRLLRRRLTRCNFTSIEEELLDITRVDDVPGSQIPAMYFDYLQSRDMASMEQVIRHNRLDVIHMPLMLEELCAMLRDPEGLDYCEDTLSCGILFERNGDLEKASACYTAIAARDTEAITRLSLIRKRAGDYDGALELWRQMVRRGEGGAFAYVEAAKVYEHVYRDPAKALRVTEACMRRLRELGLGRSDTMAELEHRRSRLLRKI